jgi:putative addiction module CopG family antidote
MTIHLPEDLDRYLESEVRSGRFSSTEDAITQALRLLRQREAQLQRKQLTPDDVNQQLLEAGLLSQIPPRPEHGTYEEFSPIAVEGEPVSETIVRERR